MIDCVPGTLRVTVNAVLFRYTIQIPAPKETPNMEKTTQIVPCATSLGGQYLRCISDELFSPGKQPHRVPAVLTYPAQNSQSTHHDNRKERKQAADNAAFLLLGKPSSSVWTSFDRRAITRPPPDIAKPKAARVTLSHAPTSKMLSPEGAEACSVLMYPRTIDVCISFAAT